MMRRFLRTTLLAAALAPLAAATLPAFAQETVIIPTRIIYPGETISADALEEVPLRRQLKNPSSVVVGMQQLDGKVARRTLLPGRMIAVGSVRDAYLVETGAPVQVMFVHGGLQIAISGVPLQSGAAGDMVRVRNIDSGVVFSGVVMADGTIRVSSS
ncbi:flagellar basal body P-ring formation chaperone FlgA [Mesorhizobium sp. CAU 1732]|uniref:flagellar basal body P-ring formation chaperone FlgA n=1 Tax=Mesorhizobium sp. CAU 1732 TaxID=3140358 RepID=UPI003260F4AB